MADVRLSAELYSALKIYPGSLRATRIYPRILFGMESAHDNGVGRRWRYAGIYLPM